jgi:ketosteroid isomerase-like protein
MSQANVQIVELAYELFNRRDIAGFLDLCGADIEWQDMGTFDTTPVVGVDAVRAYLDTVLEPWEEFRKDPEEIIDLSDDQVLGLFRATARGKGSGIEVEVRGGDLVTFKEGKVVGYTAYPREQALEVAGLEK